MSTLFHLRPQHLPKLREREVKDTCMDYLRTKGYWPDRQHVGRFKAPDGSWITQGQRGLPDYLVAHPVYPGFWIELKRPGRTADPHQSLKHEELQRCWGFRVAVIDCLEDLIAFIAEHERLAREWWTTAVPGCKGRP